MHSDYTPRCLSALTLLTYGLQIPDWFTCIFFPIYFFVITFSAFMIVRGKFCWEDLGLNLHLTGTHLVYATMRLEHPFAPELAVPMLLVVALPLFLTFLLYAMYVREAFGKDSQEKAQMACVGVGVAFFVVSLIWALSHFLSLTSY